MEKRTTVKFATHFMMLTFGNLIQILTAQRYMDYTCSPVDDRPNYGENDLFADGIEIQGHSFLSFQVKCPCNAYILLQKDKGNYDNDVVEIVLGAYQNTYSLIRDKSDLKKVTVYKEDDIVCNEEYRKFWVSWEGYDNGTVQVGKGDTRYIGNFMSWNGLNHKLNYVSIGGGFDTGYWKFQRGVTMSKMATGQSVVKRSGETRTISVKTSMSEEATTNTTSFVNNTISDKSGFNAADEGNDVTAVSVSVPVAIVTLVGIAIVIVLVIKRKRLRCRDNENTVKGNDNETKQNMHQTSGVTNEAFVDGTNHQDTETHAASRVQGTSLYAEVTEDNGESETNFYENNNIDSRINDLIEDKYGYGQYKTKTNAKSEVDTIYENTPEHSRKQLKPFTSECIYSNQDNEISSMYLNVHVLPNDCENSRKESSSVENQEEDEDSLYDHAKAGGHDWELKERDKHVLSNEKVAEEDNTSFQNVYENTTELNSSGDFATRQEDRKNNGEQDQEECNVPFYLVLEDDQSISCNNNHINFGDKDESAEYDYTSVNDNRTVMSERNNKQQTDDGHIQTDTPDRFYFVLEKENVIQDTTESGDYETSPTHEYFILEKVDS